MDYPIRFVAIDLHKAYLMVAAVDAAKTIVLPPRRMDWFQFEQWARQHLRATDQVVFEATTHAWYLHDLLQPLVARVVVADPGKLHAKIATPVKTDKRDTLAMAELLAADLIPAVWVPPVHVRQLRGVIAHRRRLIRDRTAAKNRLHALLQRNQLVPPPGDLFSVATRRWWREVDLPPLEQLRANHDLDTLQQLKWQIEDVEATLARLSTTEPWNAAVPFLVQLPGISVLAAMTILSAIGDITRFPSAAHLVGYSGLGGRIHASGQVFRQGSITKRGRPELRFVLVEAAWAATRSSPVWQQRFARLEARIGRLKAIVALARKLLVVIWHVLTKQEPDQHADPAAVTRSFQRWGQRHRLARQQGTTAQAFAQAQLAQVGLADPEEAPLPVPAAKHREIGAPG
jgi:transposase